MLAPRLDPAGLASRIRSTIAEIDALDAQAQVIAKKRAAREADVRRMTYQLARIPTDEDDAAPVLRGPEAVPIAQAARIAGNCDNGTLRRAGEEEGWVFKRGGCRGGRWYVRTADLYAWMSGRPIRS